MPYRRLSYRIELSRKVKGDKAMDVFYMFAILWALFGAIPIVLIYLTTKEAYEPSEENLS